MELFDNAIASIRLALQDFSSEDETRVLSTVRNLNAGILLLYKAKLSSLSPAGSEDILIKRDVIPKRTEDDHIIFVGTGTNTVDVAQIQRRFKSLEIQTDWERFNRINKLRNDIEHHFTGIERDAIRGAISDTFIIIRNFIELELEMDPMIELGPEAWGILLSVSDVFEQEHKNCRSALGRIDWKNVTLESAVEGLTCGKCNSQLIAPLGENREDGVECRSCGEIEGFEAFAGRALSIHFSWQSYRSLKEGGEEVLIQCPYCYNDTYIVEDQECAICGESCEHTCEFCGNEIPSSELSTGQRCGWCEHMLNKDD